MAAAHQAAAKNFEKDPLHSIVYHESLTPC